MNTDTMNSTHTTDHGSSTNAGAGLRRVSQGRLVGGVAAGIARTLNVNTLIVRLAFVVTTFWFEGLPVALYLGLWLLTGNDNDPVSPIQRWLSNLNSGYVTPNQADQQAPASNPWQYSGPVANPNPPAPQAAPPAPQATPPAPQPAAPAQPTPPSPQAAPVDTAAADEAVTSNETATADEAATTEEANPTA